MRDEGLIARVDEACLNGWPALSSVLFDGWMLRFAEGHTRRSNSVNVVARSLRPAAQGLDGRVRACEALYAARGLPTVFRLTSAAPHNELVRALDAAGYGPAEDESLVLFAKTQPASGSAAANVHFTETAPSPGWLAALARISGQDARTAALHARILDALALPAAFVAVEAQDGTVASVAFGAVHDGIVCLNSVATASAHRGRGLAGSAVGAVMAWAAARAGAQAACLPVGADNAAALSLYRRMGFTTEVLRYHYRVAGRG